MGREEDVMGKLERGEVARHPPMNYSCQGMRRGTRGDTHQYDWSVRIDAILDG